MKEILIVFLGIFVAELGDKTQIATMTYASKYGWLTAFLGSAIALLLVNVIGALLGDRIGHLLPADLIQKVAGLLFIVIGALMLTGRL